MMDGESLGEVREESWLIESAGDLKQVFELD
jgi:hypothetical protein